GAGEHGHLAACSQRIPKPGRRAAGRADRDPHGHGTGQCGRVCTGRGMACACAPAARRWTARLRRAWVFACAGCAAESDERRAREWTAALNRWCETQPGLVAFRGNCLVYRAEIMQLHGAWADALAEAHKAREWLSRLPARLAAGAAYYQLGELHRLRCELAKAEAAYREASAAGRSPQPGLALMRLANGQLEAAAVAIRREHE